MFDSSVFLSVRIRRPAQLACAIGRRPSGLLYTCDPNQMTSDCFHRQGATLQNRMAASTRIVISLRCFLGTWPRKRDNLLNLIILLNVVLAPFAIQVSFAAGPAHVIPHSDGPALPFHREAKMKVVAYSSFVGGKPVWPYQRDCSFF
jgi:hypothetical protein